MAKTVEAEIEKSPELIEQKWVDIHAHLNFLEVSPEEAIATAEKRGVRRIITIGTEPKDLQVVLDIAEKHHPKVSCTLGIHPHEAQLLTLEIEAFIETNAQRKEVVAIGEIGLDYYYNNSDPAVQREAFDRQMAIAAKLQLPVEIHTRDADQDTIDILKKYQGRVRGVLHCFTGTQWLADQALALGYNISISGIVTFKNAEDLRNVVKSVPIDRMHVETDAPFLAPAPFRGVKNAPQYVIFTAQFVAELKNMPIKDFAQQMFLNTQKMFPKLDLNLSAK